VPVLGKSYDSLSPVSPGITRAGDVWRGLRRASPGANRSYPKVQADEC
jgi:hypothetical protein